MNFADDLTADLPSPRDDEPASLRQDIVDELSDHLHCALQRELLASGGRQSPDTPAGASDHNTREQTAWQSVLTRFGNPAALAYRLWWDAMKETIMTQRYTAFMATLAAAACVVMCVLFWQSTLRDSGIQQQLLQQQQELNQTLLGELKSMQTTSLTAATNAGWAPVSVRLQSAEGVSVAGRVKIAGTAINAGNDNKLDVFRTADESGVAAFGLLPFGNYELKVDATAVGEEHNESFMLSPNTPAQLTIVCPTVLPPAVEVSFEIDVPEPLHANRLVFAAFFERSGRTTPSGSWKPESSDERSFAILFDADGQILGELIGIRGHDSIVPSIIGGDGLIASTSGTDNRTSRSAGESAICRFGPVRTIRASDRCVGLAVGAKVADEPEGDDGSHVQFSSVYRTDDSYFESFEDSDAAENQMRLKFEPTTTFWTEIVATFRTSLHVADVTIPDGWQIANVPIERELFLTFLRRRSRTERGGVTKPPRLLPQLRVMVSPAQQETLDPLPLGVGSVMTSRFDGKNARPGVLGSRVPVDDVRLLVSPELAEAIELARKLGTLEAVPVPSDEGKPDDDPSVNQQTLEILQRLAAGGNE